MEIQPSAVAPERASPFAFPAHDGRVAVHLRGGKGRLSKATLAQMTIAAAAQQAVAEQPSESRGAAAAFEIFLSGKKRFFD